MRSVALALALALASTLACAGCAARIVAGSALPLPEAPACAERSDDDLDGEPEYVVQRRYGGPDGVLLVYELLEVEGVAELGRRLEFDASGRLVGLLDVDLDATRGRALGWTYHDEGPLESFYSEVRASEDEFSDRNWRSYDLAGRFVSGRGHRMPFDWSSYREYDDQGRLVRSGGHFTDLTVYRDEKTFRYDPNGNLDELVHEDFHDASMEQRIVYRRDAKGVLQRIAEDGVHEKASTHPVTDAEVAKLLEIELAEDPRAELADWPRRPKPIDPFGRGTQWEVLEEDENGRILEVRAFSGPESTRARLRLLWSAHGTLLGVERGELRDDVWHVREATHYVCPQEAPQGPLSELEGWISSPPKR